MALELPRTLAAVLLIGALACDDDAGLPPPAPTRSDAGPVSSDVDRMDDPLENPTACPTTEPEAGDECAEAGLVCKFGEDPECRSRWVCDERGAWTLEYAMRDCGSACPSTEPKHGDACAVDRTQCTYGDAPQCRSLVLCWNGKWSRIVGTRDCDGAVHCPDRAPSSGSDCAMSEATPEGGLCVYEGGLRCACSCGWGPPEEDWEQPEAKWSCSVVSAELDPAYLRACPLVPPEEGDACDSDSSCGYVNPAECEARGAGTSLAHCAGETWTYAGD